MLKLVGGSMMGNRIFILSQNITTQYTYNWKKIISTVKKPSICPLKVMLTLSVMSQINKCFLICFKKNKISIFQYFCKKLKSERNHVETADKLPLRIRLWNKQPVLLKRAEVMKNKARLRNCPKFQEILSKSIITKSSVIPCMEY